ncbi:protein NATD1-like isoform X1 [Gouania willdenowi]|uniref:protein NATD1-like isoform X1 n=1 Tax=Gouania willdenowi TaxID=441366 RepID=UPI001056C10E|nr:protein NATD1-like isoform X1 [Gouania willdenowi]
MALKLLSRLTLFTPRLTSGHTALRTHSSSGLEMVKHDRLNHRFTVSTEAEAAESAVLLYRFTADKEVDLMSTFVPETFRGHGFAALLSQAALDFVVKEDLKAHVSCWYIKKYIEEHPQQLYKQHVLP